MWSNQKQPELRKKQTQNDEQKWLNFDQCCVLSLKNPQSLVMIIRILYKWSSWENCQVTPIFRRVPVFFIGANGAEIDEMEDVASSFSSKGLGSIAKTCGFFGVRVKCQYF